MSINELVIWAILFLTLLGVRQYYAKKEAISVEYLKGELFKIIADHKKKSQENAYVGSCGKVASVSFMT